MASIRFSTPDKVLLAAILADILFLASGALELGASLFFFLSQQNLSHDAALPSGRDAVRHLLFSRVFLFAAMANAAVVLIAFALTIPGFLAVGKRRLLRASAYAVTLCSLFTMVLGLNLWFGTLRMQASFAGTYYALDPRVQSLIQTSFNCCGYLNSTAPAFVTDDTCPSPAAAALLPGCAPSIASYANNFMDLIFTALFGMVGIDVLLVLAIVCLLSTRSRRERYRLIQEKSGFGHF